MVTSRSVPQQIEQIFSVRAGQNRFALRLLQIGQTKLNPSPLPRHCRQSKPPLCHISTVASGNHQRE
jgi:hypothetical protein